MLVALPIIDRLHLPPAALHPRHAGGSDQGIAWHGSSWSTWAAAPPAPPARWRRSCTTATDFDGSEVVLVDLDPDRLGADPQARRADGEGPRARHHDHRDDRPARRRSTDVDAVLSCFRPGGFQARVHDERIPLSTGRDRPGDAGAGRLLHGAAVDQRAAAGGAEMAEVCAATRRIFNYTNPVNIVAEAATRNSDIPLVSLCEGPIILPARAGRATSGWTRSSCRGTWSASTTAAGASSHLRRPRRIPVIAERRGSGAATTAAVGRAPARSWP